MKTTTFFAFLSLAICFTSAAYADTFSSGGNTFDIKFVTIGNLGNAADRTGDPNPAGKVDYVYRMGKFEISEDMIDKANAEGSLGITESRTVTPTHTFRAHIDSSQRENRSPRG